MSSLPAPRRPRPRSVGALLSLILYTALLVTALLLAAGQPAPAPTTTPLPPLWDRTPDISSSRPGYGIAVAD
jgi:hypothetical protein